MIEAPLPCVVAGLGRDQRAALPLPQGDHGREEEAAGDGPRSATSASSADEAGEAGSRTEVYALGEPPSRGDSKRIEDDGGDAAEKIVDYLQEKKLI